MHAFVRNDFKSLCHESTYIQGGDSVQQGLSAAFKVATEDWYRGTADKRLSLKLEATMGLHQEFRFKHTSPEEVRVFLHGLSDVALLDDRGTFFVFSELSGQPAFTFDCELIRRGVRSERACEYFAFLGLFVEALTGQFGAVEVEDL